MKWQFVMHLLCKIPRITKYVIHLFYTSTEISQNTFLLIKATPCSQMRPFLCMLRMGYCVHKHFHKCNSNFDPLVALECIRYWQETIRRLSVICVPKIPDANVEAQEWRESAHAKSKKKKMGRNTSSVLGPSNKKRHNGYPELFSFSFKVNKSDKAKFLFGVDGIYSCICDWPCNAMK